MAFTGTPIYNAYLRLMGARIGRNVVISSRHGPVCADMLTIGDNTILRKDSIVLGYRAQSNFIHIGSGRVRQQRLRRRSERDRYRHRDGRRHAARPRLVAAKRPARAGRQALSRLAGDRDDLGLLPDREHGERLVPHRLLFLDRARGAVPCRHPGADPRLLCLGSVFGRDRRRLEPRRFDAVAARHFGGRVLRCDDAWPRRGLRHPAPLHDVPEARRDLSDLRLPLPAAEHHPARQQFPILLRAVRGQLVHRELHALRRLDPEQGRADRLEHGHQPAARQSVPLQHRQRHDGVRRPVDDQHAHVGDVVPARRVEDRRQQLSRQRHLLSAERQDRRERPARHQDHDPDRWSGARERRPARLAGV